MSFNPEVSKPHELRRRGFNPRRFAPALLAVGAALALTQVAPHVPDDRKVELRLQEPSTVTSTCALAMNRSPCGRMIGLERSGDAGLTLRGHSAREPNSCQFGRLDLARPTEFVRLARLPRRGL